MTRPRFHRILLKLSGEALMGDGHYGIDPETVAGMAGEVMAAKDAGSPITVKAFKRFQLGEGIEKATNDFAAEVAAASGVPQPVA